MAGVSVDVWIAAAYGVFLLAAAHGLDRIARRASLSRGRWRMGGFTYHPEHDAWVCPEDQWLWPQSFDPGNRVMRYRASPAVCNSCPVKASCTTSNHGREVTRHVDPWPASEAERFHRGIACTVAAVGVLWPLLSMLGHRSAMELVALGTTVVVVVVGSWPLLSHLRHTPARFPDSVLKQGVKVLGLDESVAEAAKAQAMAARRRASYASDRRTAGGRA